MSPIGQRFPEHIFIFSATTVNFPSPVNLSGSGRKEGLFCYSVLVMVTF